MSLSLREASPINDHTNRKITIILAAIVFAGRQGLDCKLKALDKTNFKLIFTAEASISFLPFLLKVRHWLKYVPESGSDGTNDSFNSREPTVESELKTTFISCWTVTQ